jgi:trk system potassium uptake protein TrkH
MKTFAASERIVLFGYFILLILIGWALLALPLSWEGSSPLPTIDALFTSVSAVCVTGLITVDTAQYSLFGKTVIMLLIQFGGLGILTFSTFIFLSATRSKKVSFKSLQMVKNFYVESVESRAHHILRNIIVLTLLMEAAGMIILYFRFRTVVDQGAWFYALFHAVSAFCNAGFSLFSDSLESLNSDPVILFSIMILLISGGLGFLVIQDVFNRVRKVKKRLSLHTRLVLFTTLGLIVTGTLFFFFSEKHAAFSGMSTPVRLLNSLFQAVTPRTAGFNAVPQSEMQVSSRFLTTVLMFIGGSPASIAGGIKTTTFAIVLFAVFKDIDWTGRIRIKDRMISSQQVSKAMLFLGKAFGLLGLSVFLLTLTEISGEHAPAFVDILFESVSAFGTVGLSTGITGSLSFMGKCIIIVTMFAGRVGLISLTIPLFRDENSKLVEFPEEEVLIG